MKNYLVIIAIFFIGCNKGDSDLSGQESIKGLAYFVNNLSMYSDTTPLKKGVVKLKYAEDLSGGYIYSTYTDDLGNFKFSNLETTKNYIIYADAIKDSFSYIGSSNAKASVIAKLLLYPDTAKFNGFQLKAVDNGGSIVNSAKVYRFVNKTYFDNLFINGAIDSVVTGQSGTWALYKQVPAKYYFYGIFKIGNTTFSGKKVLSVGSNLIVRDTMLLN